MSVFLDPAKKKRAFNTTAIGFTVLSIAVAAIFVQLGRLSKTVTFNKPSNNTAGVVLSALTSKEPEQNTTSTSSPVQNINNYYSTVQGIDKSYVDKKIEDLKSFLTINSNTPLPQTVTRTYITRQNDSIVDHIGNSVSSVESMISDINQSQWTTSGSDITYSGGKVGIGIGTTPLDDSFPYRWFWGDYTPAETESFTQSMIISTEISTTTSLYPNVTSLQSHLTYNPTASLGGSQYAYIKGMVNVLDVPSTNTNDMSRAYLTGSEIAVSNNSATGPSSLVGLHAEADDYGGSTANNGEILGARIVSYATGSTLGGNVYSISANPLVVGSRVVNNAYGVNIKTGFYGSGYANNSYGLYISGPYGSNATSGIGNNYGLYINDQSSYGTSTSYNIYSAGSSAKNYLAGNLGLATTSPWRTLSVTGTVGFDGLTSSTGAGSLCLSASKQVVYNSASDACLSSLRATKHNIATSTIDALNTIIKLDPVSFVYNEGDGRTRYGFMAEDTALVDEHLATHDAEGNISGIDDRAILSVVVKAIKEIYTQLKNLVVESLTANVVYTKEINADRINVNGEICVDDTCVNKDQFKQILLQAGVGVSQIIYSITNETPSISTTTATGTPDNQTQPDQSTSLTQ